MTFAEDLATHHNQLTRRALQLQHGDHHAAEDLVQETYLRAWRFRDRYDLSTHNLIGWLLHMMRMIFLDHLKRAECRPQECALDLAEGWSAVTVDKTEVLDVDILAALDALPTIYREAVVLSDVYGFDREQMAARLGLSRELTRTRVSKGRRRMRELLGVSRD